MVSVNKCFQVDCNFYIFTRYKDDQEFFQFSPHEKPRGTVVFCNFDVKLITFLHKTVRSFASKGVYFESPLYSIGNETFQLWLRHVTLETQGTYR